MHNRGTNEIVTFLYFMCGKIASVFFSPPLPHENFSTYFFDDSEVQNLAHFGSVPNEGIKQVRIHWLLDLVTAK